MIDEIRHKLINIKNLSPVLLIGDAATVFKNNYTNKIIDVTNNVSEIISSFIDEPSVFDVTFFSSKTSEFYDFINKIKSPVIVLTKDTNLSIDILLNIKTIIKISKNNNQNMRDSRDALQLWKDETSKSFDEFCSSESPELYYLKNKFKMNKYINLFSTDK